jgi:hypothetical protein
MTSLAPGVRSAGIAATTWGCPSAGACGIEGSGYAGIIGSIIAPIIPNHFVFFITLDKLSLQTLDQHMPSLYSFVDQIVDYQHVAIKSRWKDSCDLPYAGAF